MLLTCSFVVMYIMLQTKQSVDHGPVEGCHVLLIWRLCLSSWGIWSHHMSYQTWPGCASTQHHRLVYTSVRRWNLATQHRYQLILNIIKMVFGMTVCVPNFCILKYIRLVRNWPQKVASGQMLHRTVGRADHRSPSANVQSNGLTSMTRVSGQCSKTCTECEAHLLASPKLAWPPKAPIIVSK